MTAPLSRRETLMLALLCGLLLLGFVLIFLAAPARAQEAVYAVAR